MLQVNIAADTAALGLSITNRSATLKPPAPLASAAAAAAPASGVPSSWIGGSSSSGELAWPPPPSPPPPLLASGNTPDVEHAFSGLWVEYAPPQPPAARAPPNTANRPGAPPPPPSFVRPSGVGSNTCSRALYSSGNGSMVENVRTLAGVYAPSPGVPAVAAAAAAAAAKWGDDAGGQLGESPRGVTRAADAEAGRVRTGRAEVPPSGGATCGLLPLWCSS
mmetsp:Transcript_3205/g.8904  ORF Transcript_3205/g.8904 Transcript_3205/m.8904 type:complete len:221 (+) Transcript_3205:994-1656(+)